MNVITMVLIVPVYHCIYPYLVRFKTMFLSLNSYYRTRLSDSKLDYKAPVDSLRYDGLLQWCNKM
jgi:hypothetical protein